MKPLYFVAQTLAAVTAAAILTGCAATASTSAVDSGLAGPDKDAPLPPVIVHGPGPHQITVNVLQDDSAKMASTGAQGGGKHHAKLTVYIFRAPNHKPHFKAKVIKVEESEE